MSQAGTYPASPKNEPGRESAPPIRANAAQCGGSADPATDPSPSIAGNRQLVKWSFPPRFTRVSEIGGASHIKQARHQISRRPFENCREPPSATAQSAICMRCAGTRDGSCRSCPLWSKLRRAGYIVNRKKVHRLLQLWGYL